MSKLSKTKRPVNKYFDNDLFLSYYLPYYEKYKAAVKTDSPKPDIPDFCALAIMAICENLAKCSNFSSYTYKDEMIGDGIAAIIRYFHGFNPEISSNPYGYYSRIAYYAFINRIGIERKQSKIVETLKESSDIISEFSDGESDDCNGSSIRRTQTEFAATRHAADNITFDGYAAEKAQISWAAKKMRAKQLQNIAKADTIAKNDTSLPSLF